MAYWPRILTRAIIQNGKKLAEEKQPLQKKEDLAFANIICKHLKSNAIALVRNKQLVGKGCGQTSRIDSLRQSIDKAKQFNFDLHGAVLASDAFFPFNDCVQMAHAEASKHLFSQAVLSAIKTASNIAFRTVSLW